MAVSAAEAEIQFTLKVQSDELKKMREELDNLDKSGKGAAAGSKSMLEGIKAGWIAAGAAIAGQLAFIKASLAAYVETYKSQVQLTNSLKNNAGLTGQSLRAMSGDLAKFADQVEKRFGVSDAAVNRAAARFVDAGVAVKDLKPLIEGVANAAAASGKDFETVSQMMKRAYENPAESIKLLARQGIMLNEAQYQGMSIDEQRAALLDELTTKFAGQGEAMMQADGGAKLLEVTFGNLQELVGEKVLPVFAAFAQGAVEVLEVVMGLPAPLTGLGVAIGAVGLAIKMTLGPIGWIVAGFTALMGLIYAFSDGSEAANKSIDDLAASVLEYNNAVSSSAASEAAAIESLGKLKEGSAAYEAEVQKLLTAYPRLTEAGINLKSSYKEVTEALIALNEETRAQMLLKITQKYDESADALETLTQKYVDMARARAKAAKDDPTGQSKEYKDAVVKETAALGDLNSAREAVVAAGQTLKYSEEEIGKTLSTGDSILSGYVEEMGTVPQATQAAATVTYNASMSNDAFALSLGNVAGSIALTGEAAINAGQKAKDGAIAAAGGVLSMADAIAKLALGSAAKAVATPTKKPSGGGGGSVSYADSEADVRAAALVGVEEFERRKSEIKYEFQKKEEAAEKARYKGGEGERAAHLAAIERLEKDALAKLEAERQEASLKAAVDTAEKSYAAVGSVLKSQGAGDIARNISSGLASFLPGVAGQIVGFAGTVLGDVIDFIGNKADSIVERLTEAMERASNYTARKDFFETWFPDDPELAAAQAAKAAAAYAKAFGKAGIDNMTPELAKMLAGDRDKLLSWQKRYENGGTKTRNRVNREISNYWNLNKAAMEAAGISMHDFYKIVQGDRADLKALTDTETLDGWLTATTDVKKTTLATSDAAKALKKIQTDIQVGAVDEADTLKDQLALYDALIADAIALGMSSSDINGLKADRLAIEKALNSEAEKGAGISEKVLKNAAVMAAMADKAAFEARVASGAVRKGSLAYATEGQGIYDRLITAMAGAGATQAELDTVGSQRGQFLEGALGGAAWAGLSGTGEAVSLPMMQQQAPTVVVQAPQNNSTSINIDGQNAAMPEQLARMLADYLDGIYRASGQNLSVGAFR